MIAAMLGVDFNCSVKISDCLGVLSFIRQGDCSVAVKSRIGLFAMFNCLRITVNILLPDRRITHAQVVMIGGVTILIAI